MELAWVSHQSDVGVTMKNPNKQQAGRKGGQAVTPRKSEAASENGVRGGRPIAADAAYKKSLAELNQLLEDVRAHITSHALRQETDKGNWGYNGDMNHYAGLLKELLGRK